MRIIPNKERFDMVMVGSPKIPHHLLLYKLGEKPPRAIIHALTPFHDDQPQDSSVLLYLTLAPSVGMCQETLETVLDQVSHLCPGVGFSTITLNTRWDLKGRRIYNPKKASGEDSKIVDESLQVDKVQQEQQQEVTEQAQLPKPENVAGDCGDCPT
ncbi:hypothetical protein PIB30_030418 [Stylosanthes scabra]|uniref:Uncharacterized protein n=1 Tax=Stylosanthes scabra TaxID=79078 RepID=A0ABU6Z9D8_9FABA|nr:hypothetical protein [Stylosanthes scabra]